MSQESIKNRKMTKKNLWRYYHFTQVYQTWSYALLFLWRVTDVIFIFHIGLAFALLTTFSTELCMFRKEKFVLSKKVDEQQKTPNVSIQDFKNVLKLLKQYNYLLAKLYSGSP